MHEILKKEVWVANGVTIYFITVRVCFKISERRDIYFLYKHAIVMCLCSTSSFKAFIFPLPARPNVSIRETTKKKRAKMGLDKYCRRVSPEKTLIALQKKKKKKRLAKKEANLYRFDKCNLKMPMFDKNIYAHAHP